jgi:23S rRNA (uracil1939-C5)-methyltransferase
MDQEQAAAVEVQVTDLDRQGRGIARHGTQVLFVEGCLPGDRAEVRLLPRRRGHTSAQLLRLLQPSPERRRPPCILADHCGGCSLQPFSPRGEQHWKQELVRQTLLRIGGLDVPLQPLLEAPSELGYRNRAIIPLERTADGHLRAGFYRRGSHQIVNMNRCPVLDPRLDALIAPLKADLEATDWPVDRHGSDGGGLRHLALRVGHHTGELLITLIASHGDLDGLEDQAQAWMARWPDLVGVTLNLQPRPTNLLFGSQTHTLAGRDWLHERFADLVLQINGDTFFQVHTSQAERLVPLLEAALPAPRGLLVDAYCGIGTYSLPLARLGWQVLGLEQHPGAVALAERNALLNGLSERCRFQTADVVEALEPVLPHAQALLLDPPRKGLDPRVLASIAACPPPQLLYLSCDPATLARDLRQLCADGYRLSAVQPVDFFPNTTHVETLAQLERAT